MTSNWSISASFQYFFTFESALESWGYLLYDGRTFRTVRTPREELLAKMRFFPVFRPFFEKLKGRYRHIGVGCSSTLFGAWWAPWGSILRNMNDLIRTILFWKIGHFVIFRIFGPILKGPKYDFFQKFEKSSRDTYFIVNWWKHVFLGPIDSFSAKFHISGYFRTIWWISKKSKFSDFLELWQIFNVAGSGRNWPKFF